MLPVVLLIEGLWVMHDILLSIILGVVEGFTRRYRLKRLVYVERYEDIASAIQRETNLKHWPRAWKVNLILASNPEWADLYVQIA